MYLGASGRVRRWYKVPKAGMRDKPTMILQTVRKLLPPSRVKNDIERTSINPGCLFFVIHHMLIGQEDDDSSQAAHETPPPLVGEDVCQHSTTFADVGTVAGHRGRHRVVTSDADPKEDAEEAKP